MVNIIDSSPPGLVSFLYLSCSAVIDSPGCEFNSYISKRLGQM